MLKIKMKPQPLSNSIEFMGFNEVHTTLSSAVCSSLNGAFLSLIRVATVKPGTVFPPLCL